MKYLFSLLIFLILLGCEHKVDKANPELYFGAKNMILFKRGVDLNNKKDMADSVIKIMTEVINEPTSKISNKMPIELNPYYWRANAYFTLNKHEECISDCKKILTDISTDIELYMWQAESYRNLNQPEKGLMFCRKALALGLDSATTLYETGLCYISLKNYSNACENFMQSKKMGFNPKAFEEYYSYCDSLKAY